MTFEELKAKNMDFEFCAMRIIYPTAHFKYKLIFPKGFYPISYGFDVWLGQGRVRHVNEYIRLQQKKFWREGKQSDSKIFIELSVLYPLQGLIYALKWIPPKLNI